MGWHFGNLYYCGNRSCIICTGYLKTTSRYVLALVLANSASSAKITRNCTHKCFWTAKKRKLLKLVRTCQILRMLNLVVTTICGLKRYIKSVPVRNSPSKLHMTSVHVLQILLIQEYSTSWLSSFLVHAGDR